MANIYYKVITTSTGGSNAAIKVEKYVDGVIESTANMPYNSYQQKWLDFDGFFRIQYNDSDGYRWWMEIITGIDEYADGEVIKWMYNVSVNYTLTVAVTSVLKHLIQDATTIYTVTDSVLEDLQTTTITADLFQTHGMEEPPTSEILLTLNNPKVLVWRDDEQPEITATITATPYPQTIYSPEYDMTDPTILGIEKVIAVASGDVMFAVSFDGGETWKYYTGTDWATLSEDTSGMSADTIMSVPTDKWAEVATTGTFKVRATLPSIESTLSSFLVDYLNA